VKYENIPLYTKQTIDDYVEHGVPPGGFVRAVLANDLIGALSSADYNNSRYMFEIVGYIYNNIPASCHGSHQIIDEWIERKRKERMKERENNQ